MPPCLSPPRRGNGGCRGRWGVGAPTLLARIGLAVGANLAVVATGHGNGGRATKAGEGTPYGLDLLCSPDFASSIWSRQASLLRRSEGLPFDLLTLDDLIELFGADARSSLRTLGGNTPSGRTVAVPPDGSSDRYKGSIAGFFRGATLHVTGLERRIPRIAAWSRVLAQTFGITSEVSLYLTPPGGAQGMPLHNDRNEVLVAQVVGEKSWKVWDLVGFQMLDSDTSSSGGGGRGGGGRGGGLDPVVAPFRHTVSAAAAGDGEASLELESLPAPSLEAKLEPGMFLYIPRGSLHVASTRSDAKRTSLHVTFGALSQTFSYGIAAYHLASEPSFQSLLAERGMDMQRFRQALMLLVDSREDGTAFRQSLPLGWARRARGVDVDALCTALKNGETPDTRPKEAAVNSTQLTDVATATALSTVGRALEGLLQRVFSQGPPAGAAAAGIVPPAPVTGTPRNGPAGSAALDSQPGATAGPGSREPPCVTDDMLRAVADVFHSHLDKFERDLASLSVQPRPQRRDHLELPVGLHIAYIAWGIDGPGTGEMEVRFSWCKSVEPKTEDGSAPMPPRHKAAKVRWPAAMLPMLQVVAGSTRRYIRLPDLDSGPDPVPEVLFAIQLSRLPLSPPIKLVAGIPDGTGGGPLQRSPDCQPLNGEL